MTTPWIYTRKLSHNFRGAQIHSPAIRQPTIFTAIMSRKYYVVLADFTLLNHTFDCDARIWGKCINRQICLRLCIAPIRPNFLTNWHLARIRNILSSICPSPMNRSVLSVMPSADINQLFSSFKAHNANLNYGGELKWVNGPSDAERLTNIYAYTFVKMVLNGIILYPI